MDTLTSSSNPLTDQLTATISPNPVTITPGEQITLEIELLNQGIPVDHFDFQITGLQDDWYALAPSSLQLMPGDTAKLALNLHPPRLSSVPAGSHPISLIATSTTDTIQHEIAQAVVEIAPFSQFTATLQPTQTDKKAQANLSIQNQGNHRTLFTITAKATEDNLRIFIPRRTIVVEPGRVETTRITITPTRRPLIGIPQTRPYQLTIQTDRADEQHPAGQLTIQPYLPEWIRPYLMRAIVLILLLITGFIFFSDLDRDNIPTIVEIILGIDSSDPDSDADGLADTDELNTHETNPREADTDHDSLTDWQEIMQYNTSPTDFDSDGDTIPDGDEVLLYQTDPNRCDTNGDGIPDWVEIYEFADIIDCQDP